MVWHQHEISTVALSVPNFFSTPFSPGSGVARSKEVLCYLFASIFGA
jgi:hypothetical protein